MNEAAVHMASFGPPKKGDVKSLRVCAMAVACRRGRRRLRGCGAEQLGQAERALTAGISIVVNTARLGFGLERVWVREVDGGIDVNQNRHHTIKIGITAMPIILKFSNRSCRPSCLSAFTVQLEWSQEAAEQSESAGLPPKRGRGRPKGAKNKRKVDELETHEPGSPKSTPEPSQPRKKKKTKRTDAEPQRESASATDSADKTQLQELK
ncbi:hypothetical protein B0H10DRAFT_1947435 [Mycena sp. CBHHK59/15]|nr:hypothetical protein B0H10DRAFT_1947435 [Mycena sp. CBHHK59/15]